MSGSEGKSQEAEGSAIWPEVEIARARHASEPSRYLIAVLTSGAVLTLLLVGWLVALGRPRALLAGVVLAAFVATLWLVLQVKRVRLLGAAVRVSERTTPELFRVVETVRDRLGYAKRTDVYVTEQTTVPIQLDSLLGTRILIIKGEFVGDLLAEKKDAELIFLLATYFGALKARYDRLNLILIVLNFVGVLHIFNPLINPWYRATVYSGDQMAYLCCRDLRVSLDVAFRSLVGKEMSPFVTPNGVVGQAHDVHRNLILRLYQWFAPSPHPTNRYLNLLAFAAAMEREQYVAYLNTLDAEAARKLEDFRRSHPVTGGSGVLMPLADLVAGATLLVGLVAGLSLAGNQPLGAIIPSSTEVGTESPPAAAGGSADAGSGAEGTGAEDPGTGGTGTESGTGDTGTEDAGTEETGNEDAGTEDTGTEDTGTEDTGNEDTGTEDAGTEDVGTDYQSFLASLPYGFKSTCSDQTAEFVQYYEGAQVVALCQPTNAGTPESVWFYQFANSSQAQEAFSSTTYDYASGDCPDDAPATTTWDNVTGSQAGLLGCGTDSDGRATVAWTDDAQGVFTLATGEETDTVEDIVRWWANIPAF